MGVEAPSGESTSASDGRTRDVVEEADGVTNKRTERLGTASKDGGIAPATRREANGVNVCTVNGKGQRMASIPNGIPNGKQQRSVKDTVSKDIRSAKAAVQRTQEAAAMAAENEKAQLLKLLEKTKSGLSKKLVNVENELSEMEENYITKTWTHGNVIRGWEGYIRRADRSDKSAVGNGSGSATGAPKYRKARHTDRIFSLSSSSSQARRDSADSHGIRKSTNPKKKKKR